MEQVDESDLAILLDEIVVLSKKQGNVKQEKRHAYIENVLPL